MAKSGCHAGGGAAANGDVADGQLLSTGVEHRIIRSIARGSRTRGSAITDGGTFADSIKSKDYSIALL